jgi:hypothetical protein
LPRMLRLIAVHPRANSPGRSFRDMSNLYFRMCHGLPRKTRITHSAKLSKALSSKQVVNGK